VRLFAPPTPPDFGSMPETLQSLWNKMECTQLLSASATEPVVPVVTSAVAVPGDAPAAAPAVVATVATSVAPVATASAIPAASGAASSSTDWNLDPEVTAFIKAGRFEKYVDAIKKIGVETMADIKDLTEAQLAKINMREVQLTRWKNLVAKSG